MDRCEIMDRISPLADALAEEAGPGNRVAAHAAIVLLALRGALSARMEELFAASARAFAEVAKEPCQQRKQTLSWDLLLTDVEVTNPPHGADKPTGA